MFPFEDWQAPTLTSACGEEQEDPATITWSGNNRKITVKEGCADMARIYAVVKDIAGPPLEDVRTSKPWVGVHNSPILLHVLLSLHP